MRIGSPKHVTVSYIAIFRKDILDVTGHLEEFEMVYASGIACFKPHPLAFNRDLQDLIAKICDEHKDKALISFSHTKLN